MSVESVIAYTLKALVGGVIRPDKVEQGDAPPYIVYQKISGRRIQSLAGDSGLANPTFQFDVYAVTRIAAASLRDEVRRAIQANPALGAVHLSEGAGYEEETKLYRERIDFSMWFYDDAGVLSPADAQNLLDFYGQYGGASAAFIAELTLIATG